MRGQTLSWQEQLDNDIYIVKELFGFDNLSIPTDLFQFFAKTINFIIDTTPPVLLFYSEAIIWLYGWFKNISIFLVISILSPKVSKSQRKRVFCVCVCGREREGTTLFFSQPSSPSFWKQNFFLSPSWICTHCYWKIIFALSFSNKILQS